MTLLEIFTALVIVSIGTLLAFPAYQMMYARSDLKAATREVSHALTYSRAAAMNRNSTVAVSLAMVGGEVQLSAAGVLNPRTMGSKVVAFNGGPVSFSSLGLRVGGPAGANQLVTLTDSTGLTYSIRVTPGGKVSWCPQAACP